MYQRLKKKHDSINLSDLNNILLIISIISLLISLICTNNLIIFILIFIFTYELASHIKNNKYVRFLSNFLGIILLGYTLIKLSNTILNSNIINIINLVIKIILFLDYFLIILVIIKDKKLKLLKKSNRNIKKYTFKELRSKKYNQFREDNLKEIDLYLEENLISKDSDYYKVIENNIDNKTKIDLEEYVWMNYLRFYKNKRYNKTNVFDKLNFVFIIIHVIILLLAIFVR